MTFVKKHISIRVLWHDTGWDGCVCANPRLNGSCLKLDRIGQERNDDAEEAVAGQSLADLPQEKWPCCVAERVAFMAPFEYTRIANHPYKRTSEESHGHFAPTALLHPSFSALALPFAWMLREAMEKLGETYGLDIQAEREPDLGFNTQWIQDRGNQEALLDCFCNHLKSWERGAAPFLEIRDTPLFSLERRDGQERNGEVSLIIYKKYPVSHSVAGFFYSNEKTFAAASRRVFL